MLNFDNVQKVKRMVEINCKVTREISEFTGIHWETVCLILREDLSLLYTIREQDE